MDIAGSEIRDARERLGLTQAELGALVGVGARTIGNWERDETPPTKHVARLREVLAPAAQARPLAQYSDSQLLLELAHRLSRVQQDPRGPP